MLHALLSALAVSGAPSDQGPGQLGDETPATLAVQMNFRVSKAKKTVPNCADSTATALRASASKFETTTEKNGKRKTTTTTTEQQQKKTESGKQQQKTTDKQTTNNSEAEKENKIICA